MKSLGIDIGTTTIGAAVLEDGCFITSETCKNNSFLAPTLPGERIQDAQLILDTALRTVDMLFERYPDIERIGVTGQMHGILYLDGEGNAVSPLYTWQDARGDAPCEKRAQICSRGPHICVARPISLPQQAMASLHMPIILHTVSCRWTRSRCARSEIISP